MTTSEILRSRCVKRLQRLNLDNQQYRDRLELELQVIEGANLSSYFLIVEDFISWAKNNCILVGPGRGSCAGALVSYLMEITQLDPIKWGLFFERFINPDRAKTSLPDIDVDFEEEKREQVIQYIVNKYGQDKVAQIGTFGTMKARAAVRDVAKALGFPYAMGDSLAKLVLAPIHGKPQPLSLSIEKVPELKAFFEDVSSSEHQILRIALQMEDHVKSMGVHASGVVISDTSLIDMIPLFISREGNQATQYSMDILEELGYIKFDLLGLRTLSIIAKTLELLWPIEVDLRSIEDKDEKVFSMLRAGLTAGVFQLEGAGMTELLKSQSPKSLEDLAVLVAAYRPGPLGSEGMKEYLAVRKGEDIPHYLIPELEPILADTNGWMVYQEQIMKICTDICGWTLTEADKMRKAIGKKIPELMASLEKKFIEGGVSKGFEKAKLEKLWSQVVDFAAYSFNKTVDKDTLVSTLEGEKRIEDCRKGDTVFTMDSIGNVVQSKVVALHDHGQVPLWRVEFNDGTVEKCTIDHKWLTQYGQQPLWRILNLDLQVWGTAGNQKSKDCSPEDLSQLQRDKSLGQRLDLFILSRSTQDQRAIETTSKEMSRLSSDNEDWQMEYYGKDISLRSQSKNDSQRGQDSQAELSFMSGAADQDQGQNLWEHNPYNRDEKDLFSDSKENLSQARNPKATCFSFRKVEAEKSREASGNYSQGTSQSQTFKDGSLVRAKSSSVRIQSQHSNSMWRRNQTDRFLEQRVPDSDRNRWSLALLPCQWQRNPPKDAGERQDVRARNNKETLETNSSLYGTFQGFRRIQEDQYGFSCKSNSKPESSQYNICRKIIRVSYAGRGQGYDLEVDHPSHNFLLASGLCCSNSHAACYATIAYQTAWLKTYYPTEFLCASLTLEADTPDKMARLISECRNMNVEILAPHVNESDTGFSIHGHKTIRFGLAAIKNLGDEPVSYILSERKKNGLFTNIFDFCRRVDLGKINRRKLESLILAGAFDDLGANRASMLLAIEAFWAQRELEKSYQKKKATFDKRILLWEARELEVAQAVAAGKKPKARLVKPAAPEEPILPDIKTFRVQEIELPKKLKAERELLGYYVSGHPLDSFEKSLQRAGPHQKISSLKEGNSLSDKVAVFGAITEIEKRTTKAGKTMANLKISDHEGFIDVVVFPASYERFRHLLLEDVVVRLVGRLELTAEEIPHILLSSLELLEQDTKKREVLMPLNEKSVKRLRIERDISILELSTDSGAVIRLERPN